METYLCITQMNDFIFCPRSIYFHNFYQANYNEDVYHKTWQKDGQAAHKSIEEQTYSTSTDILQGITVFSNKYNLLGKIDLFNIKTGELSERKNSVTAIYDGFRYQVYAQFFALSEMGYEVKKIKIYSKKDNKNYPIDLPAENEVQEFEEVLHKIRQFDLNLPFTQNVNKCRNCIYNPICDVYEGE